MSRMIAAFCSAWAICTPPPKVTAQMASVPNVKENVQTLQMAARPPLKSTASNVSLPGHRLQCYKLHHYHNRTFSRRQANTPVVQRKVPEPSNSDVRFTGLQKPPVRRKIEP